MNLFIGSLIAGCIIGGFLLICLVVIAGILWLADTDRDSAYFGEATASAVAIGILSGGIYFLFHLANPPW